MVVDIKDVFIGVPVPKAKCTTLTCGTEHGSPSMAVPHASDALTGAFRCCERLGHLQISLRLILKFKQYNKQHGFRDYTQDAFRPLH